MSGNSPVLEVDQWFELEYRPKGSDNKWRKNPAKRNTEAEADEWAAQWTGDGWEVRVVHVMHLRNLWSAEKLMAKRIAVQLEQAHRQQQALQAKAESERSASAERLDAKAGE